MECTISKQHNADVLPAEQPGMASILHMRRRAAVAFVVIGMALMLTGMFLYLISFVFDTQEAAICCMVACVVEIVGVAFSYRAQADFEYVPGDDAANLTIQLVRLAPYAVYTESIYIAIVTSAIFFVVAVGCRDSCTVYTWPQHLAVICCVSLAVASVRLVSRIRQRRK